MKHRNREHWFWDGVFVFLVAALLALIIFFALTFFLPDTPSAEQLCREECQRFDMGFYKTDRALPAECWCLKEGLPYSIGKVS